MIVQMSKISIIGHISERKGVFRRLQQLGLVQLEEYSLDASEREEVLSLASFDDASEDILKAEAKLASVKNVLDFLEELRSKKAKKTPKSKIKLEELTNPSLHKKTWEYVSDINKIKDDIAQTKSDINSLRNKIISLTPWQNLDLPLELRQTKTTIIYLGTLLKTALFSEFREKFQEIPNAEFKIINEDNAQYYIVLIIHKSAEQDCLSLVKQYGFTEISFPDMSGLMLENINMINHKISTLDDKLKTLNKQAFELFKNIEQIQKLHDYLINSIQRKKMQNNTLKTDKVFFIGGWIPTERLEEVKNNIESSFCAKLIEEEVKEDEDYPIMMENPRIVYPFELITELYSLPNRWEVDPNKIMAFFFFFFFGMMLSDAGYGIVMAVGCYIALKLFRFEGIIDKLVKLLFYCGISTIVWGALFGGWFGNTGEMIFGRDISIWFNPLEKPMLMLTVSLILGAVHLFAGMAVQSYMLIKRGRILDAIFDVGFWYLLLIGLGLLFLGGIAAQIGKYMAWAGAIGLVLTQGRHEKNIIKKLFSGITSLYGISGYLSDVLSYSRLLALGLATGVIGTVVNTMGSLSGLDNIVGIIVFVIVFIIGHAFNLSVSALGAYVHTSRLQYVEFFGKFFTGGGKPFKPLKFKNKYVELINDK